MEYSRRKDSRYRLCWVLMPMFWTVLWLLSLLLLIIKITNTINNNKIEKDECKLSACLRSHTIYPHLLTITYQGKDDGLTICIIKLTATSAHFAELYHLLMLNLQYSAITQNGVNITFAGSASSTSINFDSKWAHIQIWNMK